MRFVEPTGFVFLQVVCFQHAGLVFESSASASSATPGGPSKIACPQATLKKTRGTLGQQEGIIGSFLKFP